MYYYIVNYGKNYDSIPYDEFVNSDIYNVIIECDDDTYNYFYEVAIALWNDDCEEVLSILNEVNSNSEDIHYKDFCTALRWYFQDNTLTYADTKRLKDIFTEFSDVCYYNNYSKEDFICEIITILSGKEWNYRYSKGYCQGDITIMYYESYKGYTKKFWTYVDYCLWGGLTEYKVIETETEINVADFEKYCSTWYFSIYDTNYVDDKIDFEKEIQITKNDKVIYLEKISHVFYTYEIKE